MSHVTTVDLDLKSMDDLETACIKLGLTLNRGQKTYRWYGTHVGDYPLPAGFTKADLGKCEHAISVTGKPNAYEVGIARYKPGTFKTVIGKDGKPQQMDVSGKYTLLFDFWAGGHGLMEKVGQGCKRLSQRYALEVSASKMRKQGFRIQEVQTKNGIQLRCTR